MDVQNLRKFALNQRQPKGAIVPLAPSIEARDLTRRFISEDAGYYGGHQPARAALARKIGTTPATLRNVAGGRLKRICADFYARLKAEQTRRTSLSIAKALHELEMARATGVDPRSVEFRALEAAAKAAKAVMDGGHEKV